MILDPKRLEKVLVLNWTEFLDVVKLMKLVKEHAEAQLGKTVQVHRISLTRFEFVSEGFLLWIEGKALPKSGQQVNLTIEATLSCEGSLTVNNVLVD